MNVTRSPRFVTRFVLLVALALPVTASAQRRGGNNTDTPPVARLVAQPTSLTLQAGQTVQLQVTAYDAQGNVVADAARVSGPRGALRVTNDQVMGMRAGTYEIIATAFAGEGVDPITLRIPVTISWPTIRAIEVTAEPGRLYAGVTMAHKARALHADETVRPGPALLWKSSNPSVATVDRLGNVTALRPGSVTISAEAEGARGEVRHTVVASPVTSIALQLKDSILKTGDVLHLVAAARNAGGGAVPDAPITWSYNYTPDDTTLAPGGAGIIDHGLFAANAPGFFTIIAHSGNVVARKVVEVKPRDARRRISIMGRGNISNTHTSDLWPWTGKDGRDYVLVGTWGGDGYAIVFDITDISNPVRTDSVKVDARTINDVTVSPDGRYGALSREGASNRVNGVVILDLAIPAHPKVASTFDQELTGGVHNMFATNDHLFAVSGGQKYVIIDVKDIYNPKYASEYRHPNARLHDLWVHNGIAYSAQGGVGTIAVDVGNGKYGGTIQSPKLITTFPINSGHEIFPYFQKSTGKVYLFIGDEEMNRQGRVWEGTNYSAELRSPAGPVRGGVAQTSGGYTHIVDFTDPLNPRKVGRYHIEDYGSHDIIVEDDILYQAYYDGGVRIVDVSGELLGNLVDQKREIAVFKPYDPQAFTANAPFVMNAMPWKGHILFTDFNSGLWSAKLEPKPVVIP